MYGHHQLISSPCHHSMSIILANWNWTHFNPLFYRLGANRRLRKTCKSFELNQTCPVVAQSKPAAAHKDGQVYSFNRRCEGGGGDDVSLSSIATSSNPNNSSVGSSYLRNTHHHRLPLPRRTNKRAKMEKIRGKLISRGEMDTTTGAVSMN